MADTVQALKEAVEEETGTGSTTSDDLELVELEDIRFKLNDWANTLDKTDDNLEAIRHMTVPRGIPVPPGRSVRFPFPQETRFVELLNTSNQLLTRSYVQDADAGCMPLPANMSYTRREYVKTEWVSIYNPGGTTVVINDAVTGGLIIEAGFYD